MNKLRSYNLVVIGGGAAGLAVIAHFIEKITSPFAIPVSITLFEKRDRIGPGLAYSTTSDANLLNTPACTMGIYASDPNHFIKWLESNSTLWQPLFPGLQVTPYSNLPRRLYGLYLEYMGQEFEKQARLYNIRLEYQHNEVTDICFEEKKMFVVCGDDKSIYADDIVLATGGFQSSALRHLEGIDGYFASPYPEKSLLETIPPSADVCIIGTRLSAIDAVLTLAQAGHKGHLTCISRSGLFPRVQGLYGNIKRKFLTEENVRRITKNGKTLLRLKQILALVSKEIKSTGQINFRWKNFNRKISGRTLLRLEIAAATNQERLWQSALYNTNDLLIPLWRQLDEKDKKTVVEKYAGMFLTHRVAFPLISACKLDTLIRSGQLSIVSGLRLVKYSSKKKKFVIHHDKGSITSKYLINATGCCSNINLTRDPLINALKQKNVIAAHRFGGVAIDYKTLRVMDAFGEVNSHIYAIGALTKGVHLFTNLLEYITQAAHKIAKLLAAETQEAKES